MRESELVTGRSKYLELPQEIRSRIINVYNKSIEYKREVKDKTIEQVDEIEYKGILEELGVVEMYTENIKNKTQEKLSHLEEIREYIREVTATGKEQKKAYLSDIIRREITRAEDEVALLEEKVRILIGRNSTNILSSIQVEINRLAKNLERV